jgi:TP901 family phage tail tape measure protein
MALAGTAFIRVAGDFSPFERGAALATQGLERRVGSSMGRVGSRLTSAGAAMSRTGGMLTHKVTLPLAALSAASIKASADFGASMEMVHTQAGATQGEVNRLRGRVLDLAKAMPQGPNELAKGLFHLESVGLRGEKAMRALKVAADGAAVGHADLEETATALGSAWLVNIKGAGNLRHVMGLLNATVGAGNMRMGELVQALGTGVLPASKEAGLSIRDVMGALAVFTDEGYQASSAAAQFSTALHFLYNPTSKASGALESIGLKANSLAIDMHKPQGLLTALKDLKTHLEAGGRSAVEQEQILGQILPGGRGRIMLTLLNQLDRYKLKLDQIGRTSGNFDEAVRKTQQTQAYKMKVAWADIQKAAVRVGKSIGPPLIKIGSDVAKWVGKVADDFSKLPSGAQSAILKGGLILAGIGPAMKLLGLFTGGVGRLFKVASMAQRLVGAGGLLGALRGGLGGAKGTGGLTQSVATMQVGTLIARGMVGGGGAPLGGGPAGRGPRGMSTVQSRGGVLLPAGGPTAREFEREGGQAGERYVKGFRARLREGLRSPGLRSGAALGGGAALALGGGLVGGKAGSVLTTTGAGALTGGMVAGPWGAAIGGLAGLGVGLNKALSPNHAKADEKALQGLRLQLRALIETGRKGGPEFSRGAHMIGDSLFAMDKKGWKAFGHLRATADQNLKGMRDAFSRLSHNADANFGQLQTDVQRSMRGVATELQLGPSRGAKDATHAFDLISRNAKKMLRDGSITFGQYKRVVSGNIRSLAQSSDTAFASIVHTMGARSKRGTQESINTIGNYVGGVKSLWHRHVLNADQAFSLINRAFMNEAKAFGLTGAAAKQLANVQTLQSKGLNPGGRARGGLVQFGRPGDRGPDSIPAMFGSQPVVVGSGEVGAVFNGPQIAEMNAELAHRGGLRGFFERKRWPRHSEGAPARAERGGVVSGGAGKGTAAFDLPHFSRGGTMSRSQVDAVRRRAGLPPIFDWIALAESTDRPGIVNSIGATGLWQIYNHPDLVARFGPMTDPWNNARAAKVLYDQSGLSPWVSSRGAWGRHLGAGALTGGGAGIDFEKIKVPQIGGPGSLLKDIVQGAISKTVAAANKRLGRLAAEAAPAAGAGAGAVGGARGPGGVGTWNGIPVANWLIDALKWAKAHGGNTQITSGYRPGFDPHTASGHSEHQGTRYPHGAIDFGGFVDPVGPRAQAFVPALAPRLSRP